MSYYQGNDSRRITGSVKSYSRGKKKSELGGPFIASQLSSQQLVRVDAVRGGNVKLRLIRARKVNVVDKEGKTVRIDVQSIERTPSNVEYARRGILTKGTVLRTQLGLVRVSSRPGRDGVLNGVIIEDKKTEDKKTGSGAN